MKTIVRIGSINRDRIPPVIVEKLHDLVSDIDDLCRLGVTFDENDPRVSKILGLLRSVDFRPWEHRYREKDENHEFVYRKNRYYEPSDLTSFELLQFRAKSELEMIWDDERGGHYVESQLLLPKQATSILGQLLTRGCFVSNPVRELMQRDGLIGLEFREFYLRVKQSLSNEPERHQKFDWSSIPNGPWWQLASKVIMPPLSPRMVLRDKDGNPLKPGGDSGYYAVEGFYADPELRYPRSTLKKMPPFDIAFTREHWGGWKDDTDRDFVVSKRFMEVALAQKWKLTFSPVHIDEDL